MRYAFLLAVLAGCSTWTTHESGPEVRPQVEEALRADHGPGSVLVDGDRGFMIRTETLDEPVNAFMTAVADEMAKQEPRPPRIVTGASEPREVIAFANVSRSLAIGDLEIQGVRTDKGRRYVVIVQRPNRQLAASVEGTPAIETAWRRLVAETRAASGPFRHEVRLAPHGHLRDVGVDLRGLD